MTNQEINKLIIDKCTLNTEVAMHVIDKQVLEIEIEDLKREIKRLQKIIANFENERI